MKKLITYIFLATFACNTLQAVELDKMNRYIFSNLQNDVIDCFVFYGIMRKDFLERDPDDPMIKEFEKGQSITYDLYYAMLKPLGITPDEGKTKIHTLVKQRANDSAKSLINKYGQFCQDLMRNQDGRMAYWKKKYLDQ